MGLKKLEVPTSSITEVKKSPMDVFNQAREAETGVYIFNREKIAGVMLTKEQYETLLQELDTLREAVPAVQEMDEPQPVLEEMGEEESLLEGVRSSEELDHLGTLLQKQLIPGTTISAKKLDEQLVTLGFITKKTGFGGVVDIIHELNESGKIKYQLRKKRDGRTIFVEVIGEQDSQSQLFDKLIVKKFYFKEE